ncbi:hypothetical protein [Streptomyces camponoticapitis]|nr:hypothetical protein [Streptomyces camponoticapitis]
MFENEYAAVADVIDLLLQEWAFAAGIDLHGIVHFQQQRLSAGLGGDGVI